jgi:hypothetical protein
MGTTVSTIKLPDAIQCWQRFVDCHVELFNRALFKLAAWDQNQIQCKDENNISKLLSLLLQDVCSEMKSERDIHIYVPAWERPKSPINASKLQSEDVCKRPDFTCTCPNKRPGMHENYELYFHVECKVIGKDAPDKKVNKKNYVHEGIMRFDNASHKYGENVNHGMMIGYLVGESVATVVKETNKIIEKKIASHGPLSFGPNTSTTTILESKNAFIRNFVKPQSFTLIHLWVDLKSNGLFCTTPRIPTKRQKKK